MKRISTLALAGMALFLVGSAAEASTSVNVNVGGVIPPPPGVHVTVEGARPPRQPERVVVVEREEVRYKKKHGHAYGHYKHGRGHGRHDNGRHGKHD